MTTLIPTDFQHWQQQYAPRHYLLAFSGGRDSVALLDALMHSNLSAPLTLCHVHHGWSARADEWATWCVATAARYGLACEVVRIAMGDIQGESREALARHKRYQALAQRLPARGVLLTAHHQDDQAESFLLAALRGSGLAGLAAMPARKAFARGEHWRPLLSVSRAAIDAYLQAYQLDFLDDPSNADARYRRNALRHDIFPRLQAQGWQAEKSFAQSAAWLGEALAVQDLLLDRLLPDDLANPVPWQIFLADAPLQRALLRRFLARRGATMPPAARLQEWVRQAQSSAGEPRILWETWCLLKYRDGVWLLPAHEIAAPPAFAHEVDWPGMGRLRVQGNVRKDAAWALARGGMPFRGKTLKDAGQKHGIPAWLRARLPVLMSNGAVLWAGGLGYENNIHDITIEWCPTIPLTAYGQVDENIA